MIQLSRRSLGLALSALTLAPRPLFAQAAQSSPLLVADLGDGVGLHYVQTGTGEPVVFVHGSLSDYSYWLGQFGPFGQRFRTVIYSRRYNFPNRNPPRSGYSAIVDGQDLARLIETLDLGPAHIVGHSYGALTALFLGRDRPDLVRTLTLAEPPAISLLNHVSGPRSALAKMAYADIQARMVAPMIAAFAKGDLEGGVAVFIDYVFDDPHGWEKMSADARAETLRDAGEWDVMLSTGTLFPVIEPRAVAAIKSPVLILSGAKSYPFLSMIDEVLLERLPNRRRLVFADAGHQMWLKHPMACRAAVVDLIDAAR